MRGSPSGTRFASWKATRWRLSGLKIAARSASTLVKMQTRAMIFETYNFTRRNGSGFNLAYMDDDISTEGADDFDTDYMRSLFDHGYARARSGDLWNTELPPEAAF